MNNSVILIQKMIANSTNEDIFQFLILPLHAKFLAFLPLDATILDNYVPENLLMWFLFADHLFMISIFFIKFFYNFRNLFTIYFIIFLFFTIIFSKLLKYIGIPLEQSKNLHKRPNITFKHHIRLQNSFWWSLSITIKFRAKMQFLKV